MHRTSDHASSHAEPAPAYRQLLDALRKQFPQPVSDPVHDAYVVFSILRALNEVDKLKSQTPLLGAAVDPDFAAALASRVAEEGRSLEACIPELVKHLEGMFIWGHPKSQVNVIPQPSIAGIIGVLLASTYNPNLCSDESSRGAAAAEVRATAMAADLVGYDPQQSGGVFTFGGTGAMLYAVKVGLEKALPGSLQTGLRRDAVILASQNSHYCALNVAGWLGLGQQNVIHVPSRLDNSIDLHRLAAAARDALAAGKPIAAIIATMGSTDAFGIDDLRAIRALRDELVEEFSLPYRPHLHADAVIGWAWSVFNDYDFIANELGFRGRTVRALAAAHHRMRHLRLADSIGIDFHKTGFAPYVSSLVLFGDRMDLQYILRPRASMPYLFQSGEHHPGMYTLETSRSGTGPMAALANLLMLGKQGLRTLLGHVVEMAEVLREGLEAHPDLTVLNGENVGPVTLFRVYPSGVDTFSIKDRERTDRTFQERLIEYNQLNRRVFERVHADALAGHGVLLSMTDCYRPSDFGTPIAALKSYVLSPFTNDAHMQSIIADVLRARDAVLSA
ncbi:MAG TPA: pyridoxal-dependent decarboxylase [Pirellulales bacterium]|jgi:glutamate/tyrosine decarboxylase-like PLP-dependent enzyme|nr:pyridoxal-dependent decarboxylase [Pirellulales bacterium]